MGPPKSSTLGHDQSEGSALVTLGAQDSGGESSASALCMPLEADRCSFISGHDSSNVTWLLGLVGLGEGAHLFVESSVQLTTVGDPFLLASQQVPPMAPQASLTM